jgi:hypothetical protein
MSDLSDETRLMRFAIVAIVLASAALGSASCDTDSLLEVDDPDVTLPEALLDSTNLPVVRAYGIAEFGIAFGGSSTTPGAVTAGGLLGDEFFHTGTFQQNRDIDKRTVGALNGTVATVFWTLHRARRATELGARAFERSSSSTAELAELLNLAGFTYVLFAETFCSGVPFSEQVDGRFEYGQRETTEQVRARATTRFEAALGAAASGSGDASANQHYLARLGLARIALDENDYAKALSFVSGTPTSWSYQMEYSDNTVRQNNGIVGLTQTRKEISLSHNEGAKGVGYRMTPADPRMPWTVDGAGADAFARQFTPRKYNSPGSPIVLASGIEARLIEAEAALARGSSASYLPILNGLRAAMSLPPLTDPGSADARVDQLFRERAFWLFGTAHRLGDMRRLVRQYSRDPESVFPTGQYVREGTNGTMRRDAIGYGIDVNLPLPVQEESNPLIESAVCIDRRA